ncbi:hypothetical protein B0T25DRAFT_568884 [Lasiosphaeria hispida]|uniref:Uncharacterized protein n=1 Tax=Lasiosphaeria hispida TaxID=260671 RepID=A0AAJ0MEP1_9PEZI|nr:hypothetical protein B0T25DRAFT_568884 [Lasiosphaeria hispida]
MDKRPPVLLGPLSNFGGDWNLRWPSTVRYTGRQDIIVPRTTPQDDPRTSSTSSGNAQAVSPAYTARLQESDIRLLHLSPSAAEDTPLHATLEACPDNDCSEYEAVPYS